jgi:uncharacterized protein
VPRQTPTAAHVFCAHSPAGTVSPESSRPPISALAKITSRTLLVSTQRPQRVNELVVSQCDNLVLMRMNSAADLAYIGDELSFAPRALLERAGSFRIGEGLVAGMFASHPALVRFGPRIAVEGGADVPTTWAEGQAS